MAPDMFLSELSDMEMMWLWGCFIDLQYKETTIFFVRLLVTFCLLGLQKRCEFSNYQKVNIWHVNTVMALKNHNTFIMRVLANTSSSYSIQIYWFTNYSRHIIFVFIILMVYVCFWPLYKYMTLKFLVGHWSSYISSTFSFT